MQFPALDDVHDFASIEGLEPHHAGDVVSLRRWEQSNQRTQVFGKGFCEPVALAGKYSERQPGAPAETWHPVEPIQRFVPSKVSTPGIRLGASGPNGTDVGHVCSCWCRSQSERLAGTSARITAARREFGSRDIELSALQNSHVRAAHRQSLYNGRQSRRQRCAAVCSVWVMSSTVTMACVPPLTGPELST